MSTRTTVTRKDAEAVMEALRAKYAAWFLTFGTDPVTGKTDYDVMVPETDPTQLPTLAENWNDGVRTYEWAIIWEAGPDSWALADLGSETVNEEMTFLAQGFAPGTVHRDPAVSVPAGVIVEAYSSYLAVLYR